jgi:hypothetical protein
MQQLAEQWDQILARQPEDWSSMNIELELLDANQSEESALVLSPLNPWHERDWRSGIFRFRAAHTFGYGASAGMVHRCLGRLDEAGIPGEVRILRSLSDTHPVATQGPIWTVGGKAV